MHNTIISCNLSGRIVYKEREERRPGFPARFTATSVNVNPEGNRMKARVRFAPVTDDGATCPRWEVTRTVNLPTYLDESADKVVIRYAVYAALHRMGAYDLDIDWDDTP